MINLFVGFDEREAVGTHAFNASVIANTSVPVSITHLAKPALESVFKEKFGEGTNAFTVSRFLIPDLMGRRGFAIFADGADMVCTGDLAELAAMFDPLKTVQVVKHQYKTKHPRKYLGTQMEAENPDYDRKNWASLMIINCANLRWPTAEQVAKMRKIDLLQFKYLPDDQIGELPIEWNWLADELGENPNAKIIHWTCGIPGFPEYNKAPHAKQWREAHALANYSTP